MKFKKTLSVLLFIGALFLIGCRSQELSEATARDYQTYDGELKSLGGIRVNKIVTNVFQNDEGDVYYAYSERYDLSDPKYAGKRMEAYGLVTTHEELDKELFEIRRISDAPEIKVEDNAVENKEYSNEKIGFKLTYSSDWTIEESVSSVIFTAPLVKQESSGTGSVIDDFQDNVQVLITGAKLVKSTADSLDDRANEIRDYVRANYSELVGIGSELSYVGIDKLFAVKYKTADGDQFYFVPRASALYEISYAHSNKGDKVKYTNVFYDMIATFRFIPAESNTGGEVASETFVETVVEPAVQTPIPAPTGYREFESNPFKFKILYPSSWYYSGGSSGYDFSNVPIEDDSEALIRLDLSESGTVGSGGSGDKVTVTVKVGDRYYVLSGPLEFKAVMETMAESIEEITE